MSLFAKGRPLIQKPFRCSQDLVMQINRTKGALMLKTGKRISDNEFLIQLIQSPSLKSSVDFLVISDTSCSSRTGMDSRFIS